METAAWLCLAEAKPTRAVKRRGSGSDNRPLTNVNSPCSTIGTRCCTVTLWYENASPPAGSDVAACQTPCKNGHKATGSLTEMVPSWLHDHAAVREGFAALQGDRCAAESDIGEAGTLNRSTVSIGKTLFLQSVPAALLPLQSTPYTCAVEAEPQQHGVA